MIYTLLVETDDETLTLQVATDASRDAMDDDMLQSEVEACVIEQHGIEDWLQVEIISEQE